MLFLKKYLFRTICLFKKWPGFASDTSNKFNFIQDENSELILETESPLPDSNNDDNIDGGSSSSESDDATKPRDTTDSVVNRFQFTFQLPSCLLHQAEIL